MGKKGTKTSDFGVSKRESHDSTRFYESRLYEGFRIDEKRRIIDNSERVETRLFSPSIIPDTNDLREMPDFSIHLAILEFPSFTIGMNDTIEGEINRIVNLIGIINKKLIVGGRLVLIIDNQVSNTIHTSGFFPIHAIVTTRVLDLELYLRGEVILHKSPSTPPSHCGRGYANLGQIYKHGLIFSKIVPKRLKKNKKDGVEKTDTISRDQFLEYTKSVWKVSPNLLPPEIPRVKREIANFDYYFRFINLFSFKEDTIALFRSFDNDSFEKCIRSLRKRTIFFDIGEKI